MDDEGEEGPGDPVFIDERSLMGPYTGTGAIKGTEHKRREREHEDRWAYGSACRSACGSELGRDD